MKKGVRKNWKVLVISLFVVYSVAFLGNLFTSNNVNTSWYSSVKSSLTPPNWIFPVVWNFLFFLIALSLYFAWTSAKKKDKMKIVFVFGINLVLNVFWTVLFFVLENPRLAFFELIVFWVSILVMIFTAGKISKKSSWLLLPYSLWVSFAGILNYLAAF